MSSKTTIKLTGNGKWSPPQNVKNVKVYIKQLPQCLIGGGWNETAGAGAGNSIINSGRNIYCWGQGTSGQIGNNAAANASLLTQMVQASYVAVHISGGEKATYAISYSKQLFAWGSNQYAQIGDGSTTNRSSPVIIGSNLWNYVSGGARYAAGIPTDGKVYFWGENTYGQFGTNNITNYSVPTVSTTLPSGDFFKKISTGGASAVALSKTNTAYVCGLNTSGQLGLGDVNNRSSFVRVSQYAGRVMDICAGSESVHLLLNDGTIVSSGGNTSGQLGINSTASRSTWTPMTTSIRFSKLMDDMKQQTLFAISANGVLYACGDNTFGQLGNGSTTSRSTMAAVTTNISRCVSVVGAKDCVLAIAYDTAGSPAYGNNAYLFTWGKNDVGQLGLGSTSDLNNKSTPTQNFTVNGSPAMNAGTVLDVKYFSVNSSTSYSYVTQSTSPTSFTVPSFGGVPFTLTPQDFEMFLEYYA